MVDSRDARSRSFFYLFLISSFLSLFFIQNHKMSRLAPRFAIAARAVRQPTTARAIAAAFAAPHTNQTRGYRSQPMRDVMTGEIIQLPDIDVSSITCMLYNYLN